jgi:hypothetical protein
MEVLHRRCCGLDVHKATVVACLRLVSDGKVTTEVRTFQTTTADLLRLSEWLAANGCTHVAMEATGVYWKPVWHILDDGEFVLVLANAAHVKNVRAAAPYRRKATAHARSPPRWRPNPQTVAAWSGRLRLGAPVIPVPDRIGLATRPNSISRKVTEAPAGAAPTGSLISYNRRVARFNPFWSWYQACRSPDRHARHLSSRIAASTKLTPEQESLDALRRRFHFPQFPGRRLRCIHVRCMVLVRQIDSTRVKAVASGGRI